VGVEIEVQLSYDLWALRKGYYIFKNAVAHNILPIAAKIYSPKAFYALIPSWKNPDGNTIKIDSQDFGRMYVKESTLSLFNYTSPILFRPSYEDAQGVECSLYPMSLIALHKCKKELVRILKIYRHLGYDEKAPGAGVHTYMDYSLFGNTEKEYLENIKNFLWFLFKNGAIMSKLSQRTFSSTLNSDIYHLLDNDLLSKSDTELLTRFVSIKDEILKAIVTGNPVERLNIIFNKDRKHAHSLTTAERIKAIEYRWWAGTTNITTLYGYIEFCFAITEFLKKHKTEEYINNFSKFEIFVRANENYLNLEKLIGAIDGS